MKQASCHRSLSLRWSAFCLALACATAGIPKAQSDELAQLISQNQLTVSVEITPSERVVPGQRAKLTIKVATPRWFTDGTLIQRPEVPGLIILQNQDFGANANEQRGGQSWTVQRWSLDVFATAAGSFTIPPIPITVSVSTSPGHSIKGTVLTSSSVLTAELPASLQDIEHWVASPELSLSQSLEGLTEDGTVNVGTAIRRQINITAEQVMAMMLPAPVDVTIPGLQVYSESPTLRSTSNRGQLNAERRDVLTYIATAPGQTELPAVSVQWWNTDKQSLSEIALPAISITVVGAPVLAENWPYYLLFAGKLIAATSAMALFGWWAWRRNLPGKFIDITKHSAAWLRQRWRAFRSPALAKRLNPDGSAGALEATSLRER